MQSDSATTVFPINCCLLVYKLFYLCYEFVRNYRTFSNDFRIFSHTLYSLYQIFREKKRPKRKS